MSLSYGFWVIVSKGKISDLVLTVQEQWGEEKKKTNQMIWRIFSPALTYFILKVKEVSEVWALLQDFCQLVNSREEDNSTNFSFCLVFCISAIKWRPKDEHKWCFMHVFTIPFKQVPEKLEKGWSVHITHIILHTKAHIIWRLNLAKLDLVQDAVCWL